MQWNPKDYGDEAASILALAENGQRLMPLVQGEPCLGLKLSDTWNPFAFIDVCQDAGNHRGSELERAALEIQRAEWQLLFDFCARRRSC